MIKRKNPYVGPVSFTYEDREYYFGRVSEARELLAQVISQRLVLFYAQSGAGKSSLINTSLIPGLTEVGYRVFPIGRVSGIQWANLKEPVNNIFTYNLMLRLDQRREKGRKPGESREKSHKPKGYARLDLDQFIRQLILSIEGEVAAAEPTADEEALDNPEDAGPYVLVIDQFEEILTTNVDRWEDREAFFAQLGEAMNKNPLLWVVLTLREEYVAALDPFAHLMPGKMRTGFYMQRMKEAEARKAITLPAHIAGRPFTPEAAEELARQLSLVRFHGREEPIPGQFIEPVQLQVVCYQLWEKVALRDAQRGESSKHITVEDLALSPVDEALGIFYEKVLGLVDETLVSPITLRQWFEKELITEARTRGTVYEGVAKSGSLDNQVVELLESEHLVRGENRAGGRWIELTHDSFIDPILDCNRTWREQQPLIKAVLEGDTTALITSYESALAETSTETQVSEIALREWFEEELIVDTKSRGQVLFGQEKSGSIYNNVVDYLQKSGIVRKQSWAGKLWVELIHDRIIDPILVSNEHWREMNPLIKAAREWKMASEEEALLYKGAALAEALQRPDLGSLGLQVRRFLDASQEHDIQLLREPDKDKNLGRLETKKELAQSGWGILFALDADPAIKEALSELLQLRQGQAGELFRVFEGPDGYRPEETADKFLARHGAGPGPANPQKVPYYLLIAGGPEEIPWSFQYQLNLEYGTGRVHFDELDDYARYARSVSTVIQGPGSWQMPRQAVFFSVQNQDDSATKLGHNQLTTPLFEEFSRNNPSWQFRALFTEKATKSNLSSVLNSDRPPALLFTSSHALEFEAGSRLQRDHSGALLCQDWPGPEAWRGKGGLTPDLYFSADDVHDEARLLGMVAFLWGGSTVGLPSHDSFNRQTFTAPKQIAPQPLISRLPQRLLSHPKGGVLAVIGHVDRAWGYSFTWPNAGGQIGVFNQALARLVDGYPVGAAMESFGRRYGQLTAMLSMVLEEIENGKKQDPYDLAKLWTATNDARNYVIFGDPAVRINVGQAQEWQGEWPTIEPITDQEPILPVKEVISKGPVEIEPLPPAVTTTGQELLFFNGLDGDTGEYSRPPMTAEELSTFILGEEKPENLQELRIRYLREGLKGF